MTLREFLKGKGKLDKGACTEWLPFCTFEVKTGSLWAGDPYVPNAEDGCVAQVPPGTEGFFRRLDALPAYDGFVRGAKSRLQ